MAFLNATIRSQYEEKYHDEEKFPLSTVKHLADALDRCGCQCDCHREPDTLFEEHIKIDHMNGGDDDEYKKDGSFKIRLVEIQHC